VWGNSRGAHNRCISLCMLQPLHARNSAQKHSIFWATCLLLVCHKAGSPFEGVHANLFQPSRKANKNSVRPTSIGHCIPCRSLFACNASPEQGTARGPRLHTLAVVSGTSAWLWHDLDGQLPACCPEDHNSHPGLHMVHPVTASMNHSESNVWHLA